MSRSRHMTRGRKYAAGGGMHEYNAVGTPAMKEAKDTSDSFKKGGKAKGAKSKSRLDRRAAGGRSPLTTAASTSERPGGDYGSSVDSRNEKKGGRVKKKR